MFIIAVRSGHFGYRFSSGISDFESFEFRSLGSERVISNFRFRVGLDLTGSGSSRILDGWTHLGN